MQRRHCLQLLGGSAWCAASLPSFAADTSAQAVGQLAPWGKKPTPALKAQTLDGRAVTLADFAGQPLIVNFWASYCAPCRLEMPAFNQLLEQYGTQGLRVVAVNHGEMPARAAQFLRAVPFNGDVLLDRSLTQLPAWSGQALPSSFIIDAKGRVHWWHMGEIDWLATDVQTRLQAVLRVGKG